MSKIPTFLYGTAWKEDQTRLLTLKALRCGFKGIDTANQRKHYHEAAVGEALSEFLAESKTTREQLFIQTKFTYANGQDHRLPFDPKVSEYEQVAQSFESSLKHLKTSYIDSYVLHGPQFQNELSETDLYVWKTMEGLYLDKKVHYLGVSNINILQLKTLLKFAKVKPTFVQNRCFASRSWDKSIRDLCLKEHVIYQGFSLLTANAKELEDPKILAISKKYDRTIAQIIFRFSQQIGILPITGTNQEIHMKQDLDCEKFSLLNEELETIEFIK